MYMSIYYMFIQKIQAFIYPVSRTMRIRGQTKIKCEIFHLIGVFDALNFAHLLTSVILNLNFSKCIKTIQNTFYKLNACNYTDTSKVK